MLPLEFKQYIESSTKNAQVLSVKILEEFFEPDKKLKESLASMFVVYEDDPPVFLNVLSNTIRFLLKNKILSPEKIQILKNTWRSVKKISKERKGS